MSDEPTYPGLHADRHGLTQLGRIVLDAQVFGLISEDEDCAGWDLGRMQALMQRVEQQWDAIGGLPSRLPPELAARHARLYDAAIARARQRGWSAELGDDD